MPVDVQGFYYLMNLKFMSMSATEYKSLKYRGFTIDYRLGYPDPYWFVIVYFVDENPHRAIGSGKAASEDVAIQIGKAVVDREINWWQKNWGTPHLPCPYPESIFNLG